jgi:hypothetical protein
VGLYCWLEGWGGGRGLRLCNLVLWCVVSLRGARWRRRSNLLGIPGPTFEGRCSPEWKVCASSCKIFSLPGLALRAHILPELFDRFRRNGKMLRPQKISRNLT